MKLKSYIYLFDTMIVVHDSAFESEADKLECIDRLSEIEEKYDETPFSIWGDSEETFFTYENFFIIELENAPTEVYEIVKKYEIYDNENTLKGARLF